MSGNTTTNRKNTHNNKYNNNKNTPRLLQVWTIVGGELVSCSKISLVSDGAKSYVKDSEVNRVGVEDEEEEDNKDETGHVGENICEKGKICYKNEEEREKVRGTWETDRERDSEASKRSKPGGGRWSKMGDKFEEKKSTDRRSRSESDLLSDLSRSAIYHTRHLYG